MRLLAPAALVAFAFAVFVVLSGSDTEEVQQAPSARDSQEADLGGTTTTETTETTSGEGDGTLPDEFFVVKAGDTLAGIAQTTGVPVETLQELNPNLDPQALVSGQRIRLKE